MALKNWKKILNAENERWVFPAKKWKTIKTGWYTPPETLQLDIFKARNKQLYYVQVWSALSNKVIFEKKFKTKSQALKFAKEYMRKH